MRKVWSPHHNCYLPIGAWKSSRAVAAASGTAEKKIVNFFDYLRDEWREFVGNVGASPNAPVKALPDGFPQAPADLSYAEKAARSLSNIYLNNKYGCCVVAALAHGRGITSANSGAEIIFGDDQIIAMYEAMSGGQFNPADSTTDCGCDESTATQVLLTQGWADGVKALGDMRVNAKNLEEVKLAFYLLEILMSGINYPDCAITPFPAADAVWNLKGAPDTQNGHAVAYAGYTSTGMMDTRTWGYRVWTPMQDLATLASPDAGGELWAVLSPDIIDRATAKSPSGFDLAALTADLAALSTVA